MELAVGLSVFVVAFAVILTAAILPSELWTTRAASAPSSGEGGMDRCRKAMEIHKEMPVLKPVGSVAKLRQLYPNEKWDGEKSVTGSTQKGYVYGLYRRFALPEIINEDRDILVGYTQVSNWTELRGQREIFQDVHDVCVDFWKKDGEGYIPVRLYKHTDFVIGDSFGGEWQGHRRPMKLRGRKGDLVLVDVDGEVKSIPIPSIVGP